MTSKVIYSKHSNYSHHDASCDGDGNSSSSALLHPPWRTCRGLSRRHGQPRQHDPPYTLHQQQQDDLFLLWSIQRRYLNNGNGETSLVSPAIFTAERHRVPARLPRLGDTTMSQRNFPFWLSLLINMLILQFTLGELIIQIPQHQPSPLHGRQDIPTNTATGKPPWPPPPWPVAPRPPWRKNSTQLDGGVVLCISSDPNTWYCPAWMMSLQGVCRPHHLALVLH